MGDFHLSAGIFPLSSVTLSAQLELSSLGCTALSAVSRHQGARGGGGGQGQPHVSRAVVVSVSTQRCSSAGGLVGQYRMLSCSVTSTTRGTAERR